VNKIFCNFQNTSIFSYFKLKKVKISKKKNFFKVCGKVLFRTVCGKSVPKKCNEKYFSAQRAEKVCEKVLFCLPCLHDRVEKYFISIQILIMKSRFYDRKVQKKFCI
jgi:hypothetical protein